MGVNRARVSIRATVTAHRLYLGYMSCVVGSSPRCTMAPRDISSNAATVPEYVRKRELKAWTLPTKRGRALDSAHHGRSAKPGSRPKGAQITSEVELLVGIRELHFPTTSGCADGCCNVDDDGVEEEGPSLHCASGTYPVVPAKVMGIHCERRTQCTARVTSLGQTDTT